MDRVDKIIYEETQQAAYEEQCEQGFIHLMEKDKIKFICDSLREAKDFSKEIRQYLYEIEKERSLTASYGKTGQLLRVSGAAIPF